MMPLVAMADYIGNLEEANFSLAIPGQYPLGINGLGATDADCAKWLDDNTISTKEYRSRGCSDDGKALNLGLNFGPLAYDPAQMVNPPPRFALKDPYTPYTPPLGRPKVSMDPNAAQYIDMAKGMLTSLAPLLQRPGKTTTIVQKDPDYVTWGVIGGAVVVASILAIAIGKSGRKKD